MALIYDDEMAEVFKYVRYNTDTGENEFIENTPESIKKRYYELLKEDDGLENE